MAAGFVKMQLRLARGLVSVTCVVFAVGLSVPE